MTALGGAVSGPTEVTGANGPADPTAVLARRAVATVVDTLLGNLALVLTVVAARPTLWERVPAGSVEAALDRCTAFNEQAEPGALGDTVCYPIGSTAFLVDVPALLRLWLLTSAVSLVVLALNSVLLPTFTGGSSGKLLAGLRVVRPDGSNPGFWRHGGRAAALMVEGGIIAVILVLVTKGHRRIGDYIADTYVVGAASVGTPVVLPTGTPPGSPPPDTPIWDPRLDTYVTFRADLGGWLAWDDRAREWKAMHR